MKRTREGKLLTDIIFVIFKLSGLLISEGDKLIADLGLSSARWKVLGALYQSRQPTTVPDIAKMMGQTRQAVQRLSNEMKTDGLLKTEINPNHKRAKLLVLTEKGKEVFLLLEQKQIPWINSLADDFEPADLESAISVLQKVISRFESNG